MSATRTAFKLFPFTQSSIQKAGISELTWLQRTTLSIVSFNLEGINQYCFPQAFLSTVLTAIRFILSLSCTPFSYGVLDAHIYLDSQFPGKTSGKLVLNILEGLALKV